MQLKIWNENVNHAINRHYLYLISRTYLGWYQERGFLILPELTNGLLNSVVLPITKELNNNDWRSIFKNLPKAPNYQDLPNLKFKDLKPLNFIDKSFDQNSITKMQKPISILEDILENTFEMKSKLKIIILPIIFGTKTSFFHLDENTILIVKRSDIDLIYVLDAIISQIITKILKNNYESDHQSWKIREEIAEFFLYHTKINKYIDLKQHQKNQDLLFSNNLQDLSYKEKSDLYLKMLKFPIDTSDQKFNWSQINKKFSFHEMLLAQTLYQHKDHIVSYDDLATALYKENSYDRFSLQYFAKIVEQIRKKLKTAGLNNNVIFTKRGVGYGWFD